jgi:5'(3')-deoxyribonucleotidase
MKIFFDMDGVLAKYLFGKPFEALFQEFYFENLPPQTCFVEACKELSKKYDVRILSAYLEESKYAIKEKKSWLKRFLPEIPESQYMLIPCGVPKGNYVTSPDDILIDDYGLNCKSWVEAGGKVFKVSSSAIDAEKERKKHDFILDPEMSTQDIVQAVEDRINS